MNLHKVVVISNWATQKNGYSDSWMFANFYRLFIKGVSILVAPITALL